MNKLINVNLCCVLNAKRCEWCKNYYGCCIEGPTATEGNLLCGTCWEIYNREPVNYSLDFYKHVEALKPKYGK